MQDGLITKTEFTKEDLIQKIDNTIGKDVLLETFLASLSDTQTRLLLILLNSGYIQQIGALTPDFGQTISYVVEMSKILNDINSRQTKSALLLDRYHEAVESHKLTHTYAVKGHNIEHTIGVSTPQLFVISTKSSGHD